MYRLTIAQLRALLAFAEREAAHGVYVEPEYSRSFGPLDTAAVSNDVVDAERYVVWTDGVIEGPLGSGRRLLRRRPSSSRV